MDMAGITADHAAMSFRLLGISLLATPCFAAFGGFSEDFSTAKSGTPDAVRKVQEDYAKSEVDNPHYYIDLANYWFNLSQQVSITTKPADSDEFALTDSSGKPVGSIGRTGGANPEFGTAAINLLTEARKRFPSRMDIALGLAFCEQKENRDTQTAATLQGLLDQYQKSPDAFTDAADRPMSVDQAGESVAEACFSRALDFYNREQPESDSLAEKIAAAANETFPKNVKLLNLRAAIASTQDRTGDARKLLEQAHAVAPDDPVVSMNLADFCWKAEDKEQARKLASEVLESNAGEDFKADARAMLDAK